MLQSFFVAATVALATGVTAWADTLTTEAQLGQPDTAEAIEQFWKTHAITDRFAGARGAGIAFAKVVQPNRAAEKGALVIVSGRTESMLKYKELVRDLWNDGWSVYIHDHRGQGLSDREPEVMGTPQKGHVHDFQDFVNDLRSFVAGTVLTGGHKRHVLLAHSMGGAIAALFLEQGGSEVQRFDAAALSSPMLKIKGVAGLSAEVASCPIAKGMAKSAPVDFVKTGTDYKPKSFEENEYTQSPVRYDRLLKQYAAEPGIELGSPTHRWFAQACEAAFKARNGAMNVRTPIRVVVAGKDSIVHNSGATDFCRGLPTSIGGCGGPGGGPIAVPDARHELFIEQDALRRRALEPVLTFFAPRT